MSDSEQITVTGTVQASPEQVFALLADPARHPDLDGAGMLRGLAEGGTLGGVGDIFVMNMSNEVLGDYQARCTVTAYEPGRTIGWSPTLHPDGGYTDKLGDMKPGGQSFTWQLEPTGSGTQITQTYDWSQVADPQFKGLFPFLKEEQLRDSIDRVGKAAG